MVTVERPERMLPAEWDLTLLREGVFIDDSRVPGGSGPVVPVVSPATGQAIGEVRLASEEDVGNAIKAASRAFRTGPWPRTSLAERREVITRAAELLEPAYDALSSLIAMTNGIPVSSRQGDARRYFEYYSQLDLPPEDTRSAGSETARIVKEPVGVVAAVVPWNGGVSLGLGKLLPAIMAGCSVVLKGAIETPFHDIIFAEALTRAGLPPGVLNVVVADRPVAASLVRHPDVDMVTFTGSTQVGREIGSICGRNLKRAVLELGGKSAAILLDDFDLDSMTDRVLQSGILLNNGEACIAQTRILVPAHRRDEILDAIKAKVEAAEIGDPLSPSTVLGPLVTEAQRARVEGYIRLGQSEGASILTGGSRPNHLPHGWFLSPTVFCDANNGMRICQEEIFGPVAAVISYRSRAEAVELANASAFGLGAGIYSNDLDAAVDIAGQIRAGTVGINTLGASVAFPFGGFKDSGLGRRHGIEGFAEFFETKTIGFTAPAAARTGVPPGPVTE